MRELIFFLKTLGAILVIFVGGYYAFWFCAGMFIIIFGR